MNRFEIGKTYTLTGDEPHYFGSSTLAENYLGEIDFPQEAEFTEVDENGVLEFYIEDVGYSVYVSGDYGTAQTESGYEQGIDTGEPDMVNHPPHYNGHPKNIEAIEVIEDNPYLNLGNAMKYLWRVSWGSKGKDTEDLDKAIWYIEREKKRRAEAARNG